MDKRKLLRYILFTETSGALIYYTVNGTKPDPFQKLGEKFTYRYYKPFILGAGKRTVKAMATSRLVERLCIATISPVQGPACVSNMDLAQNFSTISNLNWFKNLLSF